MHYYLQSVSYISLRKSLKSGIAKNEAKYIKEFHCDCTHHKGQKLKALVAGEIRDISFKKCIWHSDDTGKIAISSG